MNAGSATKISETAIEETGTGSGVAVRGHEIASETRETRRAGVALRATDEHTEERRGGTAEAVTENVIGTGTAAGVIVQPAAVTATPLIVVVTADPSSTDDIGFPSQAIGPDNWYVYHTTRARRGEHGKVIIKEDVHETGTRRGDEARAECGRRCQLLR